jgi:hypothetical protein
LYELVGSGPKRVGSIAYFFQIFLSVPVLDPPVLTGHGSSGFGHGSGHVRSDPSGLCGSSLTCPGYVNTLPTPIQKSK